MSNFPTISHTAEICRSTRGGRDATVGMVQWILKITHYNKDQAVLQEGIYQIKTAVAIQRRNYYFKDRDSRSQ